LALSHALRFFRFPFSCSIHLRSVVVVLVSVVQLDHEVVGEGADQPADVRNHPGDPKEGIGRREGVEVVIGKARQQREEATEEGKK